jgi:hypothetical protein
VCDSAAQVTGLVTSVCVVLHVAVFTGTSAKRPVRLVVSAVLAIGVDSPAGSTSASSESLCWQSYNSS